MNKSLYGLLIAVWLAGALSAGAQESRGPQTVDIVALQAEVERLRSIMPGQAVAMTQVAYNFNNLWFAARAQNWPLAQFYFNETRVRLRWAMRITPTRKIASGEIALVPILDAFEAAELAALEQSIGAKDEQRFEASYRRTMDACSACHAASEKSFLRLHIPAVPAEAMIEFSPSN